MYVVCTCVWDETPSYLHQEGGRARYQQSLIMSAWLDGYACVAKFELPEGALLQYVCEPIPIVI